jgi:hypothetical protein
MMTVALFWKGGRSCGYMLISCPSMCLKHVPGVEQGVSRFSKKGIN